MATAGVVNGTALRAYIDGNVVAYATSCTLNLSRETRETIHKDNPGGGWAQSEVAGKSGTLTVAALFNEDGANNSPDILFTALDEGTKLTMMVSTEETGDTRYMFEAYCTEWSLAAAVEENATNDNTFTITGAVTKQTVT